MGRCSRCPGEARAGRRTCKECAAYFQAHARRKKELSAAREVCRRCGRGPRVPGQERCRTCIGRDCADGKRRYEKLKAKGLCPICGKREPEEGRVCCEACLSGAKEGAA